MITITLSETEKSYYVKSVGHSGKQNESIVCAGVSVLLETWRLTEYQLEKIEVEFDRGFLKAEIPKTQIAQILFIQLSIGLNALAQQYPTEISLIIGG